LEPPVHRAGGFFDRIDVEIGMASELDGNMETGAEDLRAVSVESVAYYAIQYPDNGLDAETRSLVVLHGWGQSSRSFLRKFATLKQQNILVIAPQAPHQFYLDMATRKVGFGWLTAFDRECGIKTVVAALDTILSQVEAETGQPLNPFLLGFSQGVSMAWRYAIHGGHPAAGVIACGGDLPPDVEKALPGRVQFPVILVHGRGDSIVPFSKSEAAETALRTIGISPETLHFDGGHDLPMALLERLPGWMKEASHSRH
jgi:phospholipase/carboxylesterase